MRSRRHDEQEERVHKVEIQSDEQEQPEVSEESQDADLERLAEDLEAMRTELDQIRSDADESRDRYLRTLADFDNYRKRQREDTSRQVNLAREELVCKLLPVLDNFQRALDSAEAGHSYDALVEGVSLTMRQMQDMLQKEGVEPIEAVGEQFDPELHEAMMRVETDEYPENTVIEEFEKGYKLGGRVLRPSRVKVAIAE